MAYADADECMVGLGLPGSIRIVDRVQCIHAAARPHLGESGGELLVGESSGSPMSRRDAWRRSGLGVGVVGSGHRDDRRGIAVHESALKLANVTMSLTSRIFFE